MRRGFHVAALALLASGLTACGLTEPAGPEADHRFGTEVEGQVAGYGAGAATLEDTTENGALTTGTVAADGTFTIDFASEPAQGLQPIRSLIDDSTDTCSSETVDDMDAEVAQVAAFTAYDEVDDVVGLLAWGDQAVLSGSDGTLNAMLYADRDVVLTASCSGFGGDAGANVTFDLRLRAGWNALHVTVNGSDTAYAMGFETGVAWSFTAAD